MAFIFTLIKPLAYLSVPIVVLRSIASSSPKGRYYVNCGVYLGTLALVATWGAAAGVVMLVARRPFDLNLFVARSFYAVASRVLDITVVLEGAEHLQKHPTVLMGNHQSMLDIIILGKCVCPCYPTLTLLSSTD
jgi:lysophosphatidate acyltransferase